MLVFVEQKKHFFIRNTCCGEKMRKLKKRIINILLVNKSRIKEKKGWIYL